MGSISERAELRLSCSAAHLCTCSFSSRHDKWEVEKVVEELLVIFNSSH